MKKDFTHELFIASKIGGGDNFIISDVPAWGIFVKSDLLDGYPGIPNDYV